MLYGVYCSDKPSLREIPYRKACYGESWIALCVYSVSVSSHHVTECQSVLIVTVFSSFGKRSHVTPLVRDVEKRTTNSMSWRNYFRFRRPSRASWTRLQLYVWQSATSNCATSRVTAILHGSVTLAPAQSPLPPLKVPRADDLMLVSGT